MFLCAGSGKTADLADGRSSQGLILKGGHLGTPVWPHLCHNDVFQLPLGHHICTCPHTLQGLLELQVTQAEMSKCLI